MPASIICRITAAALTFIAATSCVAPARSIVPGPAYALVMEGMETPAETRVFVANQYPTSSLPGCVMIASGGFAMMGGGSKIEWARKEGKKLKADFVIVTMSTSGGMRALGLAALRLSPAEFGYRQDKGVVVTVTTGNARDAGLAVGDQVLTINGVSFIDRIHELMKIQPGDLMTLRVKRDGQTQEIQFASSPNPPVHLDLAEPRSL